MTHNPAALLPAPWVLICGGLHRLGGMDRANFALAQQLLGQGRDVYLVAHEIDAQLLTHPRVHSVIVPRPLGSILLAETALRRAGFKTASRVTREWPEARVLVNGGNCDWGDINWVHSVHAAWPRCDEVAPLWFRTKASISKAKARRDERRIVPTARLVVANSKRTGQQLVDLGVEPDRIKVIPLGCEQSWRPPTAEEQAAARRVLGIPQGTAIVSFVGALGYDCNKGFDTLLAAWNLARLRNAVLVAAGSGRGFSRWQKWIADLGLRSSVRLVGFTDRIDTLLAASDAFVSPARYEAFGLNVLEALCRGIPSIASSTAGVAELYPKHLSDWLLRDSSDHCALAALLTKWSQDRDNASAAFRSFSTHPRSYTMAEMAVRIIAAAEAAHESQSFHASPATGPRARVG